MAVVAALAISTGANAAPADDLLCPSFRAITNKDGRDFADLRIVPGRPLAFARRDAGFPVAPEDCTIDTLSGGVSVSCTWRPEGYEANVRVFDGLLSQIEGCLDIDLPPATGPRAYGNATALRETEGEVGPPRGETTINLTLIEQPADAQLSLSAYHYVSLSAVYSPDDPED